MRNEAVSDGKLELARRRRRRKIRVKVAFLFPHPSLNGCSRSQCFLQGNKSTVSSNLQVSSISLFIKFHQLKQSYKAYHTANIFHQTFIISFPILSISKPLKFKSYKQLSTLSTETSCKLQWHCSKHKTFHYLTILYCESLTDILENVTDTYILKIIFMLPLFSSTSQSDL